MKDETAIKYKRCGEEKLCFADDTSKSRNANIFNQKLLDIICKFNKAAGNKQFIQIKPQ